MSPPLVIEHLDVVEQLRLRVGVARKAFADFALEFRRERFRHGVVVAVAPAAHAAGDAVCGRYVLVVVARVGRALSRVMEQAGLRAASL